MRVISAPDKAPVTGLIVLDRPPHLASGQGRQGRISSSDSGAQLTQVLAFVPMRLRRQKINTHTCRLLASAMLHTRMGLNQFWISFGRAGSPSTAPKRPQPLAPFCKFMGMQGALQPWEGPAILLDGSSTYRSNPLRPE